MFETRSSLFKSYFILIDFIFEYAQYNSAACTYKGTYQIWQAADTGTIDGVNGAVDINFAMKTTSSSDNNPGTSTEKPATSATKPTTTGCP